MIELRPMNEVEFSIYIKEAVSGYARDKVTSEGYSQEQADKISRDSFAELLPRGLRSENQFLFTVIEKSRVQKIGMIWFGKKTSAKPYAFIYDFRIEPEFRGKGYGKLVMSLLEQEVKKQGMSLIGLHVFGHNHVAIKLYEEVGYRTTNRIMYKNL